MRGSEPIPWRTSSMSAPTRSAIFAISFMKLILVASIAFAAYFVSSGRTHVHQHDALVIAVERRVQRFQLFDRARAGRTDDNAVRAHAVLDRIALFQKFGIGDNIEGNIRATCRKLGGDRRAHAISGADRHRGLVDDHHVTVQMLTDRGCHREHMAQIGTAVFVRRRADRPAMKTELRVRDCSLRIRGEAQALFVPIRGDEFGQARLEDRDLALLEARDLGRVDIDANHIVANLGKAGAGDKADITGAENTDSHQSVLNSLSASRGL